MLTKDEILRFLTNINDCWLAGRYEDLQGYFHADMTLVMPGIQNQIHGAGPIIEAYRDFATKGRVRGFELQDSHVALLEPAGTAMVKTIYALYYDYAGTRYLERGTDLHSLIKSGDRLLVWWRTLVPRSCETL